MGFFGKKFSKMRFRVIKKPKYYKYSNTGQRKRETKTRFRKVDTPSTYTPRRHYSKPREFYQKGFKY